MSSKKKKIYIVGPLPPPLGGVSSHVHYLAENLAISGFLPIVLDPYRCAGAKKVKGGYRRVDCSTFVGRIGLIFFLLFSSFGSSSPVHFHFSRMNGVFIGALCVSFLLRKCFITLHHGEIDRDFDNKCWCVKYVLLFLVRRYKRVFALSSRQQKFYERIGVDLEKITRWPVMPVVLPKDVVPVRKTEVDRRSIKIITSGMLCNSYGYRDSIRLCKMLSKETPVELAIYLYGEGNYQNFREELLSEVGQANVNFYYKTDYPEFIRELSSANLYLRPTTVDSFGLTVTEALDLGVPVVASDVCERDPRATVFTVGNVGELFKRVTEIIDGSASYCGNFRNEKPVQDIGSVWVKMYE